MRLFFLILFFQSAHLFGQEIEKNVFGFATSNTFTYFNVLDTSFIHQVNKLNPQILRFPGGAVGNFYHFNKSGYGFDFNQIDQYHDGKFPKRSRGLESARKKNKHQHNYIDDFIEDMNAVQPLQAAIQSNLRETTTRVLASLTAREERVLRMRFGIGMNTDHTLEEVGQQFSVTRERIRQIEAKALRKLKHPSRSRKLRSFLES